MDRHSKNLCSIFIDLEKNPGMLRQCCINAETLEENIPPSSEGHVSVKALTGPLKTSVGPYLTTYNID